MNARLRRLAVTATSALALLALTVGPAAAQYPPAADFGVSCTPGTPEAGDDVACAVEGAQPGELLTATAEYNPVFYEETLTADANGEAAFAFEVPAEAEGRTVTVTVVGELSGSTGETVEAEDDAAAGGDAVTPTTGQLPFTGGEVTVLLAVALSLIGAGLLFLRRREDAKVNAG